MVTQTGEYEVIQSTGDAPAAQRNMTTQAREYEVIRGTKDVHEVQKSLVTQAREYEVIRSGRKTLALQVERDGRIVVRAPRRISAGRIREFVENHWDWVEKKQRELQQKSALPECSPQEEAFYRQQAAREMAGRTAYFAALMGVSYGRITIRGQKTRWGSCSSKGNLSFNWKLMLCPPEIRDYVVVHELAHRKVMNHSREFYMEVEKVLPDYGKRQQWLKTVI